MKSLDVTLNCEGMESDLKIISGYRTRSDGFAIFMIASKHIIHMLHMPNPLTNLND